MNPYSFIPFTSFLINTILASIVLALNPGSRTNRAYGLFAYCFASWGFLNFLEWNTASQAHLQLFTRIEPLCWLPSTLLVVNFVYVLVKRPRDLIFWFFCVIVTLWSVLAVATGCLLIGFKQTYWGQISIVTNVYLPAVLMTSLVPGSFGIYMLIKAYRNALDRHFRTQLRYLTIGMLSMFVLVFSESVFRTSLMHNDSVPFLGSFFLIIQSIFVFFAIARYRFLNVDAQDAAHEIFSRVHEGVILLNLNKGISDMNKAAQDFFGTTKEEQAGDLERLFGNGYRFDENYKNREITYSHNGRVKIGILSQSDLFDRGRLIGKLVIVHDVTQEREEEKKRVQLEYNVLQSHASRLESLGMLAGGIAHDFNNLLSGVIGYATILRLDKNGLNDKQRSSAEKIITVGRQVADLTKKLMTFARRNVSEMVVFNLRETIADTVSLLEHTLGRKIKIITDLQAQNASLKGDRAQIQNMLFNMAINARDAMPDGGEVRFTMRNEQLDGAEVKALNKDAEGGAYVVVDIEDTGTGMTDEVKKRIFDPFFTTKQPGKGTGLGLSSAYGIAGSHKGFISVDSTIGKGTVFHVYLPVLTGTLPEEPASVPQKATGKGNILLVDDEVMVRATTARMLQELGYKVITFSNGEEALKWYREHNGQADLVLLDVMMPGMTGDKCAEELQKINPVVKIIFISGYPGTLSVDKLEALSQAGGPVKMVQKPFPLEHLSMMVRNTINA